MPKNQLQADYGKLLESIGITVKNDAPYLLDDAIQILKNQSTKEYVRMLASRLSKILNNEKYEHLKLFYMFIPATILSFI